MAMPTPAGGEELPRGQHYACPHPMDCRHGSKGPERRQDTCLGLPRDSGCRLGPCRGAILVPVPTPHPFLQPSRPQRLWGQEGEGLPAPNPTFQERTAFPDSDGPRGPILAQAQLHQEEGQPCDEQHDEVGDEEDAWEKERGSGSGGWPAPVRAPQRTDVRGSDSWWGHVSRQDAAEQGKLLGAAGSILGVIPSRQVPHESRSGGLSWELVGSRWPWLGVGGGSSTGGAAVHAAVVLRALGCSGLQDAPTADPSVSSGDTLTSPSLHSLSHQLPSSGGSPVPCSLSHAKFVLEKDIFQGRNRHFPAGSQLQPKPILSWW